MKVLINYDSYIDIDDEDGKAKITMKTKKDKDTNIFVSTKLSAEQLDRLITALVTVRATIVNKDV